MGLGLRALAQTSRPDLEFYTRAYSRILPHLGVHCYRTQSSWCAVASKAEPSARVAQHSACLCLHVVAMTCSLHCALAPSRLALRAASSRTQSQTLGSTCMANAMARSLHDSEGDASRPFPLRPLPPII